MGRPAPANVTRSAALSPGASSSASISSSGRPGPTWTLAATSTWRTRPATGAVREVSIFIDSVTATTSPAATSSPSPTVMATTTPGAWLRTRPPSSRAIRCGTPLTSTTTSVSCSAVTVR